jgi:tyrosinase
MKKFSFFPTSIALIIFLIPNLFISQALAACFSNLPSPILKFEETESIEVDGNEFTRHRMSVVNASAFPNELFLEAPQLPACGLNSNSSRTWLDIFDNNDQRVYGFCGAGLNSVLNQIWFATPNGEIPPHQVYIKFRDRECNTTLNSNKIFTSPVRVRQNIKTFATDPNRLAAIRNAITTMQSRPATDPTSWNYQANMHGDPGTDGPSQTAWNTCQHGSWHFLAWHRMYLYFFERIMRKASGDPDFNIPYWNYSDDSDPNARRIPFPYRQPADSTNPLFVLNRNSTMNNGGLLPASSVDTSAGLNELNYSSPSGSNASFGGQRTGPGHSRSPHSIFERTPHDTIHGNVGGWMGSFNRAARDPVFWLHHTNIDRLWEVWLAQGGGRSNPTAGSGDPWLNQSFTFFDENGTQVNLTGSEILNTVSQLNYRYDTMPITSPFFILSVENLKAKRDSRPILPKLPQVRPIPVRNMNKLLVKKNTKHLNLKQRPLSVQLKLPQELNVPVRSKLTLHLKGVMVEALPEGHYEVYVNLPDGMKPNYKSDYYVGNLAFFGPEITSKRKLMTHSFSLEKIEKKLKKANKWTGEINVKFIKVGPTPYDKSRPTIGAKPGSIKINEISIRRE